MLFDSEKVIHYTEGDCWALAIAVHELTGLPMLAVGYSGDSEPSNERYWCHVVVQVEGLMVLDITGLNPGDVVVSEYMKTHGVFFDISKEDLRLPIEDADHSGFSHCESWEQIREDAVRLVEAYIPERALVPC